MSNELTLNEYQEGAAKTAIYPRIFTEQQVIQIAGILSAALPQLHTVDGATIQEEVEWAMDLIETPFNRLVYPILGLVGEAGEIANKVKKIARDNGGNLDPDQQLDLSKEIGDTLWYQAATASSLEVTLGEVGGANLKKLADRQRRGVLQGSGDDR
jgi:NTP pyrophosphatase (non-canonical NTP hydrolase)